MLKIVYIPELVDDVLAYIESKKRWERSKKFPNFFSNKKEKYQDYMNKMKILEDKYRRRMESKYPKRSTISNSQIFFSLNSQATTSTPTPSAPPFDF